MIESSGGLIPCGDDEHSILTTSGGIMPCGRSRERMPLPPPPRLSFRHINPVKNPEKLSEYMHLIEENDRIFNMVIHPSYYSGNKKSSLEDWVSRFFFFAGIIGIFGKFFKNSIFDDIGYHRVRHYHLFHLLVIVSNLYSDSQNFKNSQKHKSEKSPNNYDKKSKDEEE